MTEIQAPSTLGVRGVLRRVGAHRRVLVVAWALLISAASASHFVAQEPSVLMGTRTDGVAESIAVLDRGGPPLVASDVPYYHGIALSHLLPVGTSDDQGIYVFLPYLGHWTGEHDPGVLMKWLFTGAFTLLIFLIPLLMFELFGSLLVAFAAPILVLNRFDWIQRLDLYWSLAWIMLLGLPTLLLAYRWWRAGLRRRATALLCALMLAASFASAMRLDAGLPVLVGALGIVAFAGTDRWLHPRTWRFARPTWQTMRRPLVAVALIVLYLSIASFGMAAVRDYRNSVIHTSSLGSNLPTQHPFWHNAYVGLGYLPNRYGIAWEDAVSADLVQRTHPGTPYLSPKYESTLRSAYLHLLRTDPGFVLDNYWVKGRTIFADALKRFWLTPILVAFGLLLPRRRRETAVTLLLAAPALLFGAANPMLTIPVPSYTLGWTGAWGAIWLLAIGWSLAELTGAIARGDLRRLFSRKWTRPALVLVGVAALVAVLAGTAKPEVRLTADADNIYPSNATSLTATAPAPARTLAPWRFAGSLPAGWKPVSATLLQADTGQWTENGLYIRTSTAPGSVAVTGPSTLLRPGSYSIVGRGRIFAGGLTLAVRDAQGRRLGASHYWYGQDQILGQPMFTTFTLRSPARVHASLENWAPFANASAWVVWDLALQRVLPAGTYYGPRADALSPTSSLPAKALRSWPFGPGTPQDWATVGTPGSVQVASGLGLVTTTGPSAVQIASTPLGMGPGSYVLAVQGRVVKGGLTIAAVDSTGKVIASRRFWSGQPFSATNLMALPFTLASSAQVRFTFSNWAPAASTSTWIVQNVALLGRS